MSINASSSISELAAALSARVVSSVELVEDAVDRLDRHEPTLNAMITTTADVALAQARVADAAIASGEAGPLTGIPLVHKDIFCTRDVRTTCGSRMLDNFIAPYDATIVTRLSQAGMTMIGKSNMDEFAMGSSNETSYYGPVRNPWDVERVPGGSSGGSAALVAAGVVGAATCTDTGGSIRQPASLCGITGIKPTYGCVSRFGMIAFASSLDQAGVMTRSAEDAAYVLEAMAGHDPRDSTSVRRPADPYVSRLEEPLRGLRIGIAREHFGEGLDPRIETVVRAAIAELEKLGATLVDVSLPNTALSIPAYYVVAPAECSSNLSRFDGVRYGYRAEDPDSLEDLYKRSRTEGFGTEVQRRILIGTYALSAGYYDAYYLKAQKMRRLISRDFADAFESVDAIVGPTSPTTAFRLGEKMDDPVTMYLCDINTNAVNLAGLPGVSVPAGFVDDLPVGLQIIGGYFEEGRILSIAHRFQQVTDWHRRMPPVFG